MQFETQLQTTTSKSYYTLLSYNKYNDCVYRYKCNICDGYFVTKYKDINDNTINHCHYIRHTKSKKHIKALKTC